MTATYYAVCANAGGPISVLLDGDTEAEALAEFDRMDRREVIDSVRTDIEEALGLADCQDLCDETFAAELRAAGAREIRYIGMPGRREDGDGWTLWSTGD